jgi:hypothetical protein
MFEDTNIPDGIDSERRLNKYTTNLDKQVRAAQSRLAFARKMEGVLFEGEASISKHDIGRAYFANDAKRETFVLIANVPSESPFLSMLIADDIPPGIEATVATDFGDYPEYGALTKKIVFKKNGSDRQT